MPGFGEYLKGLREKQRMSLRDVERRTGVSNAYLGQIELGKRPPPHPKILKKLAPIYDVHVYELMRAAEYLGDAQNQCEEVNQLQWAINAIQKDPEYDFGTRLDVDGLTLEVMRFIVDMYEKTTGKKLLSRGTGDEINAVGH
jgi:transcriptional regulator with XRE-family HTH domain